MNRVYWTRDYNPINTTVAKLIYDLRRDEEEDLIMDAVTERDFYLDADERLTFDALITPYNRIERKMQIMRRFINRAGTELKVREDAPDAPGLEITDPFKRNGTAQVAAIFYLTDGQTITILFHNPDTTPSKIAPTDELISWKWMINKKDVTVVVAPEHGKDLDVNEVARRIMKLAEKNSKAFQRANAKRAERLRNLEANDRQIADLEAQLKKAEADLEAAKVECEDTQKKRDEAKKAAEERAKKKPEIDPKIQALLDAAFEKADPVSYRVRDVSALFAFMGHPLKKNKNGNWECANKFDVPKDKLGKMMYWNTWSEYVRLMENLEYYPQNGRFISLRKDVDPWDIQKAFSREGTKMVGGIKDPNADESEIVKQLSYDTWQLVDGYVKKAGNDRLEVDIEGILNDNAVLNNYEYSGPDSINQLYKSGGVPMTKEEADAWVRNLLGCYIDLNDGSIRTKNGEKVEPYEIRAVTERGRMNKFSGNLSEKTAEEILKIVVGVGLKTNRIDKEYEDVLNGQWKIVRTDKYSSDGADYVTIEATDGEMVAKIDINDISDGMIVNVHGIAHIAETGRYLSQVKIEDPEKTRIRSLAGFAKEEYNWQTAPLDTPEQILEFADKVDGWAYYSDENSKGYRLAQALRKKWPTFTGKDSLGIPFTATSDEYGTWSLFGVMNGEDGEQRYLDTVIEAFTMAYENGTLKAVGTETPKISDEVQSLLNGAFKKRKDGNYMCFRPSLLFSYFGYPMKDDDPNVLKDETLQPIDQSGKALSASEFKDFVFKLARMKFVTNEGKFVLRNGEEFDPFIIKKMFIRKGRVGIDPSGSVEDVVNRLPVEMGTMVRGAVMRSSDNTRLNIVDTHQMLQNVGLWTPDPEDEEGGTLSPIFVNGRMLKPDEASAWVDRFNGSYIDLRDGTLRYSDGTEFKVEDITVSAGVANKYVGDIPKGSAQELYSRIAEIYIKDYPTASAYGPNSLRDGWPVTESKTESAGDIHQITVTVSDGVGKVSAIATYENDTDRLDVRLTNGVRIDFKERDFIVALPTTVTGPEREIIMELAGFKRFENGGTETGGGQTDDGWADDKAYCDRVINGELAQMGNVTEVIDKLADIGDRAEASGDAERLAHVTKAFDIVQAAVVAAAKKVM